MKRVFDLIVSTLSLILLSPVLLIVAILIKADGNGSVIFKQYRVGKDDELFEIYKFRSMKEEAPEVASNSLSNVDNYVTTVGKVLRKTSLDELPQLINIIKGEMSLVGPRPVIEDESEKELLGLRRKYGINVLVPGLTGWAQVNGRDNMSIERKIELEREYLSNQSFFFDLKVLTITALKVFKQDGILEGSSKDFEDMI